MTRRPIALLAALAIALAAGLACSFSYSSKSSSDSSNSSSESSSNSSQSSSGSSSPDQQQARNYQKDVADYTEAYVISGGKDGGFLRGVGDIASKRGVSDWESDDNTWRGIGRGLARVNVSATQLEVYKNNWTGGDAERMAGIQKGFDAAR